MNNKPTLTEAYQQGRDDEYEHTKIQIEIEDNSLYLRSENE